GWRSLPRNTPSPHGFDIASALLSAATFGLLIGSVDALGHGEGFPLFLAEMVTTIGLGYLLVRRQL
ncbi:MAG TPA: hypothetical protein VG274_02675, partial [Rhizomicrobium sp.]|nr:hypothetical protein [Rhizomicrobium sp.]